MSKEKGFRDSHSLDILKGLLNEGMMAIHIRDGAGRIEEVYEAHVSAEIGDPCLLTRLKYIDGAAGTSRQTLAQEEKVVAWPGYELVSAGAGNDFDSIP